MGGAVTGADGPRVVVVSQRHLRRYPAFAACVEIEDVLVEMLGADLLMLEQARSTIVTRALAPRARLRNAVIERIPAWRIYELDGLRAGPYDLAISVTDDLFELSELAAVPGWRELADAFVAVVFEEWPSGVESGTARTRPVLSQLTHLYLTMHTVLPTLERTTGVRATYLPPGMDILVNPLRLGTERRIDVLNPGRQDPGQHRVMLDWAAANDGFYHYDSAGLGAIPDLAAHRRAYREMVSRSWVYVANMARCNMPELRLGAEEVALRQFEAMAAGCIIAGQAPGGRAGEVLAGLPGVFHLPLGASEMPPELDELLRSPDELDRMAIAQRLAALEAHDVLHRWDVIAGDLGYPELPGVAARRARLDQERERVGALQRRSPA